MKFTEENLKNQLKKTLGNRPAAAIPAPALPAQPAAAAHKGKLAAERTPRTGEAGKVRNPKTVIKTTLSLYPADIDKADHIADYLRQHGKSNINRSAATRLALRTVKLSYALVETLEQIQKEDQRRGSGE